MRDFHLTFSPFSFVSLTEGKVVKEINTHSTAYVKGIIQQSKAQEYLELSTRDEHLPFSISAEDSEGAESVVFYGVVTNLELAHEGGVVTMTVEAKSGSYLMDITEHFRTFQNPSTTHSDVLDLLGRTYNDYNFILKTENKASTEVNQNADLSFKNAYSSMAEANTLDVKLVQGAAADGKTTVTNGSETLASQTQASFLKSGFSSAEPIEANITKVSVDSEREEQAAAMREKWSMVSQEETTPNTTEISAVYQDYPLGQFTVQYHETDWAFARRLASRLNTFLVPADTMPGIRYYFGMPHTDGHVLDDSEDYRIVKDYGLYDDKTRQGLDGVSEADAICYVVEQRELYAVGDLVQFLGMDLYIDQIVTTFLGQELVHTYYLRPQSGLRVARTYNDRLIGASLDAQVLAVQRDEVQVQVIGDENGEQTIVQWFPFATVYSSPDGTGWYCMPEPGDSVRLYMPNREERQAVVFNAVHEASGARSNPDIKSMRNKYGKEIRFTPNTLVMTNNAGMEISIIDGEGIRIESDKAIYIKADGDISMTSGAGLSMLAADSVVVQQGGTSLVLDDNISFVGGKLRMQ